MNDNRSSRELFQISLKKSLFSVISAVLLAAAAVISHDQTIFLLSVSLPFLICIITGALTFYRHGDTGASPACALAGPAISLAVRTAVWSVFIFVFGSGFPEDSVPKNVCLAFTGCVSGFFLTASSFFLLSSVALALSLVSVVWGRKMKKRKGISRTCTAAVPVFFCAALYYALMLFLSSFTDISGLSNMAVEYFLTEELLWFEVTVSLASLPALAALTVFLLKPLRSAGGPIKKQRCTAGIARQAKK